MGLKVFLPLAIIAVVLFALFSYLNARGPLQVDCGDAVPAVCEQAWRETAARDQGLTSLIPVTRVRVSADHPSESAECLDVMIERFIFSRAVINDCL